MSSAPGENGVWRVRRSGEVRLRRFDAEALAFNPLTWETHLLTGNAVHILARLLTSPATHDELAHTVAAFSNLDSPSRAHRESVSRVLAELRDFGMIVQTPELSDAAPRS